MEEAATTLEHDDGCDIKLVDNNESIVSSEIPKKMNLYLGQEEYTEEAASSKKRASKSKNMGQRIEWSEKEEIGIWILRLFTWKQCLDLKGSKEIGPQRLQWGVFEVCPYSSGDPRRPLDSDSCGLNKSLF